MYYFERALRGDIMFFFVYFPSTLTIHVTVA